MGFRVGRRCIVMVGLAQAPSRSGNKATRNPAELRRACSTSSTARASKRLRDGYLRGVATENGLPFCASLDPGCHPSLILPRLGGVCRFGMATQHRCLLLGAFDTERVGDRDDARNMTSSVLCRKHGGYTEPTPRDGTRPSRFQERKQNTIVLPVP